MLKELQFKDTYNPQFADQSDLKSAKLAAKYGNKLLMANEASNELTQLKMVQQTTYDTGQFIPATGYYPQYSIIRRHAIINKSYTVDRKRPPPPIYKRRIIEPKVEKAIIENFQGVQRLRQPLLEHEQSLLEVALNDAGFSARKITALPFEEGNTKAVIETFEKMDRLQRMIGVTDPYSATGLSALAQHNRRRGGNQRKGIDVESIDTDFKKTFLSHDKAELDRYIFEIMEESDLGGPLQNYYMAQGGAINQPTALAKYVRTAIFNLISGFRHRLGNDDIGEQRMPAEVDDIVKYFDYQKNDMNLNREDFNDYNQQDLERRAMKAADDYFQDLPDDMRRELVMKVIKYSTMQDETFNNVIQSYPHLATKYGFAGAMQIQVQGGDANMVAQNTEELQPLERKNNQQRLYQPQNFVVDQSQYDAQSFIAQQIPVVSYADPANGSLKAKKNKKSKKGGKTYLEDLGAPSINMDVLKSQQDVLDVPTQRNTSFTRVLRSNAMSVAAATYNATIGKLSMPSMSSLFGGGKKPEDDPSANMGNSMQGMTASAQPDINAARTKGQMQAGNIGLGMLTYQNIIQGNDTDAMGYKSANDGSQAVRDVGSMMASLGMMNLGSEQSFKALPFQDPNDMAAQQTIANTKQGEQSELKFEESSEAIPHLRSGLRALPRKNPHGGDYNEEMYKESLYYEQLENYLKEIEDPKGAEYRKEVLAKDGGTLFLNHLSNISAANFKGSEYNVDGRGDTRDTFQMRNYWRNYVESNKGTNTMDLDAITWSRDKAVQSEAIQKGMDSYASLYPHFNEKNITGFASKAMDRLNASVFSNRTAGSAQTLNRAYNAWKMMARDGGDWGTLSMERNSEDLKKALDDNSSAFKDLFREHRGLFADKKGFTPEQKQVVNIARNTIPQKQQKLFDSLPDTTKTIVAMSMMPDFAQNLQQSLQDFGGNAKFFLEQGKTLNHQFTVPTLDGANGYGSAGSSSSSAQKKKSNAFLSKDYPKVLIDIAGQFELQDPLGGQGTPKSEKYDPLKIYNELIRVGFDPAEDSALIKMRPEIKEKFDRENKEYEENREAMDKKDAQIMMKRYIYSEKHNEMVDKALEEKKKAEEEKKEEPKQKPIDQMTAEDLTEAARRVPPQQPRPPASPPKTRNQSTKAPLTGRVNSQSSTQQEDAMERAAQNVKKQVKDKPEHEGMLEGYAIDFEKKLKDPEAGMEPADKDLYILSKLQQNAAKTDGMSVNTLIQTLTASEGRLKQFYKGDSVTSAVPGGFDLTQISKNKDLKSQMESISQGFGKMTRAAFYKYATAEKDLTEVDTVIGTVQRTAPALDHMTRVILHNVASQAMDSDESDEEVHQQKFKQAFLKMYDSIDAKKSVAHAHVKERLQKSTLSKNGNPFSVLSAESSYADISLSMSDKAIGDYIRTLLGNSNGITSLRSGQKGAKKAPSQKEASQPIEEEKKEESELPNDQTNTASQASSKSKTSNQSKAEANIPQGVDFKNKKTWPADLGTVQRATLNNMRKQWIAEQGLKTESESDTGKRNKKQKDKAKSPKAKSPKGMQTRSSKK